MLTNKQKAYIKANRYDLSLTEIAIALGISWREVNAHLKTLQAEDKVVKKDYFDVNEVSNWVIPHTKMSDYRETMRTYYRLNHPENKLLIGYIEVPSNLKIEESPKFMAFIEQTGITPVYKKVNSQAYENWAKNTDAELKINIGLLI